MSPPRGGAATQPDLGANQEGTNREDEFLSVRTLAHQARKVADDLDLALSGSSIRKLVRQFLAGGRGDLRSFVITYADPTGETAIHNILTKRRRT